MARFDERYITLYKYLKDLFPLPDWMLKWMRKRYRSIWPSVGVEATESYLDILKGSFQPLSDMWKDAKDTFKPYRTKTSLLNDVLQPIYGIGNLLKGSAYLALIVPLFLFNLFWSATKVKSFNQWPNVGLLYNGVITLSWFMDGLLSIARGATQLATTPLVWFAKMPLRGIITAFTDKKDLLIENRPNMQNFVNQAEQLFKTDSWDNCHKSIQIIDVIHEKYENSL